MLDPRTIAEHLDGLAKPPGSLGRLEALAARLAQVQGRLDPVTRPRRSGARCFRWTRQRWTNCGWKTTPAQPLS